MLLNVYVKYRVAQTPFLALHLKFYPLRLYLLPFLFKVITQDLSFNEVHDEYLVDLLLVSFKMLQVFLFPHSLTEILTNELLLHRLFNDLVWLLFLINFNFKVLLNDLNLKFLPLPSMIKLYEFIFHLMLNYQVVCL